MSTNIDFVATTKRGSTGEPVRLAQEWLCLNDFSVVLDSEFGPGTELAVNRFQAKAALTPTGQVDQPTWDALVAPMRGALQMMPAGSRNLRQLVVAYAEQHLAVHPREVGGENSGPWVRLYMDGRQGKPWPWCAGFVTYIVRQASQTLGVPTTIPRNFGCDTLAGDAEAKGLLLRTKTAADFAKVAPGMLFLVRKGPFHWQHIGIVTHVEGEAMTTIEGNTNDDGVPEGFEVCRRSRGMKDKDFVMV